MSLGTFNHDIWQSRVREVQAVFRAFELFLSNEDAIAQHLDAQQEALPQLADLSRAAAEHYLTRAADLYRRQVIVVACTLLEAMIRDFFTALFVRHPMRMSNYVENHGKGEGRRRILLKDVVTAESKEWLIEDLAKECAKKIPEKKVIARLSKKLGSKKLGSSLVSPHRWAHPSAQICEICG